MPAQARNRQRTSQSLRALLGLLLHTLLAENSEAAQPRIRGLQPEFAHRYPPHSTSFACLDGSSSIPITRINDNYCDCIDGSDEPGTAACVNGRFYCRNRGHVPLLLNASSIDDRICDCCDGSDEAPGLCKNTCAEAGSANRAALKARAAAFKHGLKAKERYVRDAVSSRQKWEAELKRTEQEEAELKKAVGKLQSKKERIERLEEKEWQLQEASRKQAEEQAAAQKSNEEAASLSSSEDTQTEAQVEEAEPSGSESAEGGPSTDAGDVQKALEEVEGKEEEEEMSEEEKGRQIAAQWTHDPQAAGREASQQAEQPQDVNVDEVKVPHVPKYEPPDLGADSSPSGAPESEQAGEEDAGSSSSQQQGAMRKGFIWPGQRKAQVHSLMRQAAGILASARQWLSKKLGWESADSRSFRQKVKDDHTAQTNLLNEAGRRKADLQAKLQLDAGPNNEFLALVDKCFTANVEKYVYEVCLFKNAAQKDGGLSTSLGSWQGFAEGYSALLFTHGQHCWNGPQRSLRVDVECGAKEELSSVEEPSRCEYTAKMTTPACCSTEEAHAVQEQLDVAEKELTEREEL